MKAATCIKAARNKRISKERRNDAEESYFSRSNRFIINCSTMVSRSAVADTWHPTIDLRFALLSVANLESAISLRKFNLKFKLGFECYVFELKTERPMYTDRRYLRIFVSLYGIRGTVHECTIEHHRAMTRVRSLNMILQLDAASCIEYKFPIRAPNIRNSFSPTALLCRFANEQRTMVSVR